MALAPECGWTLACSAPNRRLARSMASDLDLVDELAAAVVALARVALGVLVGQDAADRPQDRGADEVLRGDQLDAVALPPLFLGRSPRRRRRRFQASGATSGWRHRRSASALLARLIRRGSGPGLPGGAGADRGGARPASVPCDVPGDRSAMTGGREEVDDAGPGHRRRRLHRQRRGRAAAAAPGTRWSSSTTSGAATPRPVLEGPASTSCDLRDRERTLEAVVRQTRSRGGAPLRRGHDRARVGRRSGPLLRDQRRRQPQPARRDAGAGVRRFVFSSTAAVYGVPAGAADHGRRRRPSRSTPTAGRS